MADTNLQVKIGLDDNISSGLKKIEGNFGNFNSSLQSNIGSSIKTIAKIGTVLSTTGSIVAGFGIKTSGDLQALSSSFTTLTGSVEEGQKVFKELKKLGASTPFETADLAKATQTMLSFGMSVEDSQKNLKMLGDISLGNKDKLAGLTLAFSQVESTGRLMGQDLLQMINNGFNPLQVISEKTGKSMAVLKKEMEQGKITAKDVAGAFETATSEGGLFYKGMDTGAKTLNGTFSTLWDNIKNATAGVAGLSEEGTILKGSFLDLVQNGVNKLNDVLSKINWVKLGQDINNTIQTAINGVKGLRALIFEGDFRGSDNLFGMGEDSGFVAFVLDARKSVILFFEALKTNQQLIGFVSGAIDVFKKIITPAIPTIIAFAGILLYLGTQVLSALQYAWQELKDPILQVMDAILTFWKAVQPAIIAFATIFTILVVPVLQSMFAIAVQIFKGWWLVISGTLNMIAGIFNSVFGIIIGLFTGDFSRAKESFQNGIKGLGQFLGGLWTIIGAPFKGVFDGIQNMLKGINFFGIAVAWIEQLINGIKSKVGGVGEAIKNSIGSGVSNLFGRKAIGGIATGGQYLVGETGPEMVTLPQGSRVSRSSETRDMMQSKDKGIIQNNYITMNNSVDWEIGTSILARKLRLS